MKHSPLRSFTIVEMLVVLIISGIVVVLIYSILNLTVKIISEQKAQTEYEVEFLQLYNCLLNDMEKSSEIKKSETGFILYNATSSLSYHFDEGFIIRETNEKDTFQLSFTDLALLFKNIPVETTEQLVDHISISAGDEKNFQTLYLNKFYDAATLLK